MPRPSTRRFGRLRGDGSGFPSERDWEKSTLLTPQPAGYDPALVGDGGGLPFPPAAFAEPGGGLDEDDPAVQALIAMLSRQKATASGSPPTSLDRWRLLARADQEVLFGYGVPPSVLTVVMRQDSRRHGWLPRLVTKQASLRAVRDGVRASSWRPDPTREPEPGDTVLRILVTEQNRAGGKRADDRLLAPDLHIGEDELVLTTFVSPRSGYQTPGAAPETPARIALPEPLGEREVVDGALFGPAPPEPPE
jgi:hypothetical protein